MIFKFWGTKIKFDLNLRD